jgi:hypothetical protein
LILLDSRGALFWVAGTACIRAFMDASSIMHMRVHSDYAQFADAVSFVWVGQVVGCGASMHAVMLLLACIFAENEATRNGSDAFSPHPNNILGLWGTTHEASGVAVIPQQMSCQLNSVASVLFLPAA